MGFIRRQLGTSLSPVVLSTVLPFLLLFSACSSLKAFSPNPPPLTLIEANRSLPNDAERRFATRASERLFSWLEESGLSVRRIPEEAAARGGIPGRIAILPYNPALSPSLKTQISRFLQQGGRLIVFYSGDPDLASWVGVRLGPYMRAETPGQWSAMRFTRDAPPLTPARLVQTSGNIRPAFPLDSKGRVIAWWEDASGTLRNEPAWTMTDRAAWMSHLLLDGDSPSRRQLLLALAVHFDPRLLPLAGQRALDRSGAMPPYPNGQHLLQAIRMRSPLPPSVSQELATLEREMARLRHLAARGEWKTVIANEVLLQQQFSQTFAASLAPIRGEFRAVWNHSGLGLNHGSNSWDQTARLLAEHGFNAVFPHVAWAGLAHYPSRLVPQSDIGRALGDPLKKCLEASVPRGIAVHAWVACWNLEGAPSSLVERFRAQNRLQQDSSGQIMTWLCPSRPENVEHQLAILTEIAERYPVTGIQLDYIRFPSSKSCFCPACRSAFESHLKRSRVRRWPADVLPSGSLFAAFTEWRTGQISRFVRLARERLRTVRPSATLSAAVYGYYPGCIQSLGQDWALWLRNDWVSFVCPMNYEENLDRFKRYLQTQMPLATRSDRIIPGIGVTASTSRLNPIQTLEQIEAVRASGATGFVLFDLNPVLITEHLPALRSLR